MKLGKRASPQGQTLDLRAAEASWSLRHRPRRPSLGVIVVIIGTALVTAGIIAGIYFLTNKATNKAKSDMQKAVAKVGKLMILPTDETPTYGTVYDASKLKSETFFAHAQGGDQVLIYQKAKLTILYRPSINKIVNVGPLIVGNQGSPYVTSRIAIANGTGNDALLDKMTQAVTQAYPNAHIVWKGNASRNYPTTIAIDETKRDQPLDEQIADSLNIQAGQQPINEPAPDTDFLIIIGEDYH